MYKILDLVQEGIKCKNNSDFLNTLRKIRKIPNELIAKMVEAKLEQDITILLGRQKNKQYVGKSYLVGVCQKCGEVVSNTNILRNGHRRISVEMEHGQEEIKIPRIIHKECKGSIKADFKIFVGQRRSRSLVELSRDFLADYIEGMSHRGAARIEGHRNNTNYSAMKSWNNLQGVANELPEINTPLPENIILFGDEISIRLREIKKSKHSKKQEIFGLELVRIIPETLVTQAIALEIVYERTEAEWIKVFEKLKARGVKRITLLVRDGSVIMENAARTVLEVEIVQECHFHRIRSIFKDLEKRLKTKLITKNKYEKSMKQVFALFQAKNTETARKLLSDISDVEIFKKLSSRFDVLFGNLDKEQIYLTNNYIERAIKDFKRRIKPMECFKTFEGAKNFAKVFLYKEYLRKEKKDWISEVFSLIPIDQKIYLKELNEKLEKTYDIVQPEQLNWKIFELKSMPAVVALNSPSKIGYKLKKLIRYGEYIPYKVELDLN